MNYKQLYRTYKQQSRDELTTDLFRYYVTKYLTAGVHYDVIRQKLHEYNENAIDRIIEVRKIINLQKTLKINKN